LQCVAVCCSVLQCVAVCCSVLQGVPVCCSVLQCVAVCCSVLQCVAVCRSVLQCVAVPLSNPPPVTFHQKDPPFHLSGRCTTHLSFVDGYCSTLQALLDFFEVHLGFTELSTHVSTHVLGLSTHVGFRV